MATLHTCARLQPSEARQSNAELMDIHINLLLGNAWLNRKKEVELSEQPGVA
jgi:hypothetical protein